MIEKAKGRIQGVILEARGRRFLLLRLAVWFVVSLSISLVFFQEFWASIGTMLSPKWIFIQHHAAPWGMLVLCGIGLWLKRKRIYKKMEVRPHFAFILLGTALVVGAVLMTSTQDFLVFQVLLAVLGGFIALFGKAAKIPAILLGIYGFVIGFPLIIKRLVDLPYAMSAITPLMWIVTGLGYPFQNQGQLVHFTSYSGESISLAVTTGCAGPVTMGVFLAIFILMVLDVPPPPKKATWLFLFGVAGTWLQSVIRLIIVLLVGYYWGEEAVWMAHFWSIYILFPLWYLLFVYIYFRQVGRPVQMGRGLGSQNTQVVRA